MTRETATVWRAAGRRWFTKRAAIRAICRQRINEACDCESADTDDCGRVTFPGRPCRFHDNDRSYYRAVMARLEPFARRAALSAARQRGGTE